MSPTAIEYGKCYRDLAVVVAVLGPVTILQRMWWIAFILLAAIAVLAAFVAIGQLERRINPPEAAAIAARADEQHAAVMKEWLEGPAVDVEPPPKPPTDFRYENVNGQRTMVVTPAAGWRPAPAGRSRPLC